MRRLFTLYAFLLPLLLSCGNRNETVAPAPWGDVAEEDTSDNFDLWQIQHNGEMIVAAMSAPDIYYEYRGRGLGAQYLLCDRFAQKIGVGIRVLLCSDTTEMLQRLENGDADVMLVPLDSLKESGFVSLKNHWVVKDDKPELTRAIDEWYDPKLLAEVKDEEKRLLTTPSVRRRVFAPMLNAKGGVISKYDEMFQRHSQSIRWDWRLMAAQCYQESTFDPKARSWAGAQGLMQIMPQTARHLGLSPEEVWEPEKNIAAAARYLGELKGAFSDIRDPRERENFVLACYNGGSFHIRDAMALARKNGADDQHWESVARYVLLLSQPEYYRDPVVKYGYMRGSETVEYVRRIRERFQSYRGVKSRGTYHYMTPQRAKRQKKRFS